MLAVKHYRPPIYSGNVVLFRPALDEAYALQPGRVVNIDGGCVDHANYWGEFIAGGIDVEVVTGDHDSMVLGPYVRALAAKLRVRLATAQAVATRGKVSEADVSSESATEALAGFAAGEGRCRAVMLSLSQRCAPRNRGNIPPIARIYQVDERRVSAWMERWQVWGFVGLYDRPRSGRPTNFTFCGALSSMTGYRSRRIPHSNAFIKRWKIS